MRTPSRAWFGALVALAVAGLVFEATAAGAGNSSLLGTPAPVVTVPAPVTTLLPAAVAPSLTVAPAAAAAGDTVTITGANHPATCVVNGLSTLMVVWDDGTVAATVPALTGGAFTAGVTVPASTPPGGHQLASQCQIPGTAAVVMATAGVRVTTPAPTTTTPPATAPPATTPPTTPPTIAGTVVPTTSAPTTVADTGPADAPVASVEQASVNTGPAPVVAPAATPPTTAAATAPATTAAPTAAPASARTAAAPHATTQPAPAPRVAAAPTQLAAPAAPTPAAANPAPAPSATAPRSARPQSPDRYRRSLFGDALHAPSILPAGGLRRLARNGVSALLLLAIAAVSGELFNSAYAEHRDRFSPPGPIKRVVAWLAARKPTSQLAEFAAFGLITAVLYALMDPEFGLDRRTLLDIVGLVVAVATVTLAYTLPGYLARRRHGVPARFHSYPGLLLLGGACVAVSRIAHLLPGYIVGDFGEFESEDGDVPRDADGRAVATGAVTLLVVALAAWIAWHVVNHAAARPGAGLPVLVADAVLSAIVVVALEWLVWGLLPFRFCDGARVLAWRRSAWVALYLPSIVLFARIAAPSGGPLSASAALPLLAVSAAAAGTWLFFRLRTTTEPAPATV